MLPTLTRYLQTLENPEGLFRRLSGLELCRDGQGRPLFFTGNSAVVFKVCLRGHFLRLKCYTRPVATDLKAVYGDNFLREELFVYADREGGQWTDVVAEEWIEGTTLDHALRLACTRRDRTTLARLSERFDALAAEMLADDQAHGDLKPENLLVDSEGRLHPIDFDAAFLPPLAGRPSPELGTEAYRHPARTLSDFDARLDDYPAALISATLAFLSLDPSAMEAFPPTDGVLFDPREILGRRSAAYAAALSRLSAEGDAVHYRIARLLTWPLPQLPGIAELFALTQRCATAPERTPELFERDGLWGYRTPACEVIPPLYDCGFEFTEGAAAVRLGSSWHYIGLRGEHLLDASAYDAVKPFRCGRARIRKADRWLSVDRSGRTLEEELG